MRHPETKGQLGAGEGGGSCPALPIRLDPQRGGRDGALSGLRLSDVWTRANSEVVAAKMDGVVWKESLYYRKTGERRGSALIQERPCVITALTPEHPRLLQGEQSRHQLRRPGLLPVAGLLGVAEEGHSRAARRGSADADPLAPPDSPSSPSVFSQ